MKIYTTCGYFSPFFAIILKDKLPDSLNVTCSLVISDRVESKWRHDLRMIAHFSIPTNQRIAVQVISFKPSICSISARLYLVDIKYIWAQDFIEFTSPTKPQNLVKWICSTYSDRFARIDARIGTLSLSQSLTDPLISMSSVSLNLTITLNDCLSPALVFGHDLNYQRWNNFSLPSSQDV